MVLRLDPDHPMVWRTPDSVQFGIEAPSVVLDGVAAPVERFLGALALGVAAPALSAVAAESGLAEAELDRLLIELAPVLDEGPAPPSLAGRRVAVDGRGAAAEAIARLVRGLGATLAEAPEITGATGAGRAAGPARPASSARLAGSAGSVGSASSAGSAGSATNAAAAATADAGSRSQVDVAVVISHYATSPRRAAAWLRDDVPHLLVEFGDRSIRVGPLVSPGRGPCAECLELARAEADPAWPAIAAQAIFRQAPSADALGVAAATAVVGRILVEHREGAGWAETAVRLPRRGFGSTGAADSADSAGAAGSADSPGAAGRADDAGSAGTGPGAALSVERHRAHPRCGCRSPAGNEREHVLRCGVIRSPPTRARAAPGLA